MSAVLAVEHLAKSFGGVQAVRDVSFGVDAGELLALIGPNGAGKTTCFNIERVLAATPVACDSTDAKSSASRRGRSGGSASAGRSRSPRPSPR
jgi:ABC-type branched-subunit amino acid transport system ATPase component